MTGGWEEIVTLLIPAITPLITAGIKKLAPKIPKILMVIINPLLGAVIGGLGGLGGEVGAVMGLTGIGLREGVDQTKKLLTKAAGGQAGP